jgi:SAM-dependent methyltransferase
LGFEVICTDYHEPCEHVRQLHRRWQVQDRITYTAADIFKLAYPENHLDVVACKSVIGGLCSNYKDRSTRTPEQQKLAVEEVRRVLKPGGFFFGAENLVGTRLHMALRRKRTKGNLGWRYLQLSEIYWLLDGYSKCELKPHGYLGTHWAKFRTLNLLCAAADGCLSKILPADWLYISFIRARK